MNKKNIHDEITELEQKISEAEAEHEKMKRINRYYRRCRTLNGCPDLRDDVSMKNLNKSHGKPFSDKVIRLNWVRIKECKNMLSRMVTLRDTGDGWEFNGGRIEIDRKCGEIRLCGASDEVRQRIAELGVVFYSTASDGSPMMLYFENELRGLLYMTRKYNSLYPKKNRRN